jgi:FKBP-type peptidyl-prolyl cis-trans isomerase FklB
MKIMKKNIIMALVGLSSPFLFADETQDRLSYAIGVEVTRPIMKENISINKAAFIEGVHDSLSGKDLKMTEEDIKLSISTLVQEMTQKKENEIKLVAERNKKEGENFLALNKKEKNIVTLPSGIQYKVISASGLKKHPGPKDTVTTHYQGTLIDGTKFDSSYDRGEPVKFSLDQVITGWTEVLQLMSPGDKWQVVIPSELAYGQYAPSPVIGPNKTLIFDIELLDYQATKA